MPTIDCQKGSLWASFFIVFLLLATPLGGSLSAIAEPAIHQFSIEDSFSAARLTEVANSNSWFALLHYDKHTTHIIDPTFLLSSDNFSAERELRLTLQELYNNPQARCRFPARYEWLRQELNLPELSLDDCRDLREFEVRAPADDISLIFASENISQPSSMMGHVLVKMDGVNSEGREVSHAISFYTDTRGVNLPKLFYESMVVGKKGYFALTPYSEKLNRYHLNEGRNIWDYKLLLDSHRKKIIQYHFYELKQTDLTYFFDDYNCATLTQFVLSIAGATPEEGSLLWVTPVDVVKLINQQGLVESTQLIPAPRWEIRMLNNELGRNTQLLIKNSIDNNQPDQLRTISSDKKRFIAYEIAEDYLELSINNNPKKTEATQQTLAQIRSDRMQDPQFEIDISQYKTPIKTPQDSQISIGGLRWMGEDFIKIDLLPSSHKIHDDNRQYFAETELTLGEISLINSTDESKTRLHHFTLYGVRSLMPRDKFSGGLSGSFQLGINQQIYSDLNPHTQVYTEGSLGHTYKLGEISVYALIGGGIANSKMDTYAYALPQTGIILNGPGNLKSHLSAQTFTASSNEVPDQNKWMFEQSIYFHKDWSAIINYGKNDIENIKEEEISFTIKRYF